MGRQKLSWKQKLEVVHQSAQDDRRWSSEPIASVGKLCRMLEDLQKAQGTFQQASDAPEEHSAQLRAFEEWLLQHGARGPVGVWTLGKVHGKGTGVIASAPIEAGAEVTTIPRRVMFTAASREARVAALNPLLQEPLIKATPTLELAVILAHHMLIGDSSFYAPYIRVLPREFDVPLFWKPHTFETLKRRGLDALLARAVGSVRAAVVQYYHVWQAIKRLDGAGGLTAHNYTWDLHRKALCAIVTRQNAIPDASGEKSLLALIPGWDMANHEFGELTTFFDMEQDSLSLNAMRRFEAGEEVTMCYGRRNNEELLLYSGFCSPANPYDSIKLEIQLQEDEILKIRQMLWTRHSGSQPLSGSIVEVPIASATGGEPSEEAMLAAVCATVSKQDATAMLRASHGGVMDILAQLSEGAPVVALHYLRDSLQQAMRKLDAGSDDGSESKAGADEVSHAANELERRLDAHIDVIVQSNRQILAQHVDAVNKRLETST